MAKEIVPGHEDFTLNEDGSVTVPTSINASEIKLTPKASSSGAEGTIFYCTDNYIYVATE